MLGVVQLEHRRRDRQLESGLVTAVSEGVAKIIAAGNGAADTATVFVYAQGGWYVQTSNTGNSLRGVFFLSDGRKGFAVGNAGTMLATTERRRELGRAHERHERGAELRVVHASRHRLGRGRDGRRAQERQRGTTWSRVTVSATENLTCVRFVGTRNGWIAGAGVILRTTNGGTTRTRSSPTALQLNGLSFSDASNGWAARQQRYRARHARRRRVVVRRAALAHVAGARGGRAPQQHRAWIVGAPGHAGALERDRGLARVEHPRRAPARCTSCAACRS